MFGDVYAMINCVQCLSHYSLRMFPNMESKEEKKYIDSFNANVGNGCGCWKKQTFVIPCNPLRLQVEKKRYTHAYISIYFHIL